MKKRNMVLMIVLFSLPLLIYIFCELSLNIVANTVVSNIPQNQYLAAEVRFNRALWIYYTGDKEWQLEKISLLRTICKLAEGAGPEEITEERDGVVYLASHYLLAESKKRNLTGLKKQITWLVVAKWISKNWDVDRCLSYLVDRIYYGHGYYGLKEAAAGYFGKEPKDLSSDEISLLIAATISPAYYDLRNKDEKLLKKSEEIKEMILKSKSWR